MYKRQIVILRVEISINLQQYVLNLKKRHTNWQWFGKLLSITVLTV